MYTVTITFAPGARDVRQFVLDDYAQALGLFKTLQTVADVWAVHFQRTQDGDVIDYYFS